MKTRLMSALLVACAIAASAAPAFGDDEGTVAAQVTVAAPCIQVNPTQLDFGTLGFSSDSNNVTFATQALTAANCGAAASLLAHGSDATSTGGSTWTVDPDDSTLCTSTNRYAQRVSNGGASFPLSANQNVQIRSLTAGEAAPLDAIVVMPCVGSSGAGEVMTFSYVFTAVLS